MRLVAMVYATSDTEEEKEKEKENEEKIHTREEEGS